MPVHVPKVPRRKLLTRPRSQLHWATGKKTTSRTSDKENSNVTVPTASSHRDALSPGPALGRGSPVGPLVWLKITLTGHDH